MEPWFDAQMAGKIGGLLGGLFGGLWCGFILGGMSGFYISRGLKKLTYCLYGITFVFSLTLLGIGLFALFQRQPRHVWYPFILSGGIVGLVTACVFPVIRKRFIDREKQIMAIEDL